MQRILIVEDEPHLAELYQAELEDEGYRVTTALDGPSALVCAQQSPYDLIVLDIKLSEMHGLQVLQKIKQDYKKIPVILLTAYSTYKDDFSTWLADAYLVKSSDLSELKQTIRQLLALA